MAIKYAIITGASTGIGLELAVLAADAGYDLLLAADTSLTEVQARVGSSVSVETLEGDLSTIEGVDRLFAATNGRTVDLLCANAGHGQGGAFLNQGVDDWRHVVDTNITGTVYLLQQGLKAMTARGAGKVLVTGSIAGYIPGSFNAVYNGTKAFVDNFCDAIRNELKDHKGIQITTLMPGATETEFFERADMEDTKVGASTKADAGKVAKDGWDALMSGKDTIVSGLMNKLQVAASGVVPPSVLAEAHRKQAEPGSAE